MTHLSSFFTSQPPSTEGKYETGVLEQIKNKTVLECRFLCVLLSVPVCPLIKDEREKEGGTHNEMRVGL